MLYEQNKDIKKSNESYEKNLTALNKAIFIER